MGQNLACIDCCRSTCIQYLLNLMHSPGTDVRKQPAAFLAADNIGLSSRHHPTSCGAVKTETTSLDDLNC